MTLRSLSPKANDKVIALVFVFQGSTFPSVELAKTYQLSELDQVNEGHEVPAKFAVIGDPIAHSLSPHLHQPALEALNIKARYIKLHVPEGQVPEALQALRERNFEGVNVTVPHKGAALDWCDEVDQPARLMGSVNTIAFTPDGSLGWNTDGPGFVRAIKEEFQIDLSGLKVTVLGAGGGAGRAIATQCALSACERLVLVNRTPEKLAPLVQNLQPLLKSTKLEGLGNRLRSLTFDDPLLAEEISESDLIVNTTSLGLKRMDPAPIPPSFLSPHHLVFDTVYGSHPTKLLVQAREAGARGADGRSLLLHQGALSFSLWLGQDPPLEVMKQGLQQAR